MLCVSCRNFWVLLILEMILNAVKNLKRTPHHLNCESSVFMIRLLFLLHYNCLNSNPEPFQSVNQPP